MAEQMISGTFALCDTAGAKRKLKASAMNTTVNNAEYFVCIRYMLLSFILQNTAGIALGVIELAVPERPHKAAEPEAAHYKRDWYQVEENIHLFLHPVKPQGIGHDKQR
jgi:hypothetical protein